MSCSGIQHDGESSLATGEVLWYGIGVISSVFERRGMELRGFTLVELLIVVAVIAVIAVIVLPGILSTKMAANEASAISSLRTIRSALFVYSKRFHAAGTLADTAQAGLIDDVLGSGEKAGYSFEIYIAEPKDDSGIIASPTEWGSTGERRFKINWMGQIIATAKEDDLTVSEGVPLGSGQ